MKALVIIKKEYKQIVKKKSFIISTILMPVMMGAFIFLPMLVSKYGRTEKTIQIADKSQFIAPKIIAENESFKKHMLRFTKISVENQKDEEIRLTGEQKILDRKIDGFLFIPENVKETRKVSFSALNISDIQSNKVIIETLQRLVSRQVLIDNQIDPELVDQATQSIQMETRKVKKEGVSKASSGMEYILPFFMLTILFSVLMGYGQLIMRGIIEEKNNRIIEVLISSTNTFQLFYGKIIGIGLAGLTQVSVWVLLGTLFLGKNALGINQDIVSFLTLELGIYFIIFFLIGYFMYSILFSIIGACVNTDQEAQQFAAPITYLMIIPFIIGIMVTQNPNTPIIVISSLFPLFTPTLMFMRICVAVPSLFQIILSIVMSVLFTMGLAWIGAKIFRTGILMYGKKPTISEIARWIRHK